MIVRSGSFAVSIAALLVSTSTSAAAAETVRLLPSSLEMPTHVGPLYYQGEPKSWPDKRMGTAYSFGAPGLKLDVYIYDAGITDIPDGPDSQAVCEQFEQAKYDIQRAGYRDIVLKREQLARMGPNQDPPLSREAVYEAVINDTPTVSYLWITGVSRNFVKLRFSASAQYRDELDEARRVVLTTMGDAIRPHLTQVPVAPVSKPESGTRIVINSSNVDDLEFGMLYLAGVAGLADKHPEARPPCGGPLTPSFDGELEAFSTAAGMSEAGLGGSAFGKRIFDVQKAGFLDEFVWIYRHQEFWGDESPATLELAAFQKWRKKHLKHFKVPQFGYVEGAATRTLPVEPVEAGSPN